MLETGPDGPCDGGQIHEIPPGVTAGRDFVVCG